MPNQSVHALLFGRIVTVQKVAVDRKVIALLALRNFPELA